MIKIVFFAGTADAEGRVIEANAGQTLMRAAVDAGIDGIAADCGGTLTCATCHVMVREPWHALLPAMHDDENDMLDFTACPRQPNSRLSCQIILAGTMEGMQLELPASQYS